MRKDSPFKVYAYVQHLFGMMGVRENNTRDSKSNEKLSEALKLNHPPAIPHTHTKKIIF